jgi:hypothetical membrane protein
MQYKSPDAASRAASDVVSKTASDARSKAPSERTRVIDGDSGRAGERRWNQFIRWSGLSAMAGSVSFVLLFTIAGFLRPGYSPIRQAISDLGVGPMAWLVNIPMGTLGLLLTAFGLAFSEAMRPVMSSTWRWVCTTLVALPGVGLVGASVFTEDPSTLLMHILVGATLGLYLPVVTFFLVGLQLRRNSEWRGHGTYSLVVSLATVAAIAFMQFAFVPSSPLAGLGLGGLAERVDLIVILAWYFVMGWRLFWLNRQK